MATIQDVAKAAGVAASTVSRYLNGQLKVTPATEARLIDAVATLGYVPNVQAKNLARRRSGAIGFVVPEMSNPYFGSIADHVVEAVERRGLMVLLCSTRSQAVKESSYIDLLASGAIDGMLYLGSFRSNVRLAAAIHGGLPVVVVDEPIAGLPEVHSVVMDDYAGGYQAASYLVALGHRRIAFVSGPAELGSVTERRRGYCDALVKAGAAQPAGALHRAVRGQRAAPAARGARATHGGVRGQRLHRARHAVRGGNTRHPGARGPVGGGFRRHQVQPVRAATADHDQVAGRAPRADRRDTAVRPDGRDGGRGQDRGAARGAHRPGVRGPAGRSRGYLIAPTTPSTPEESEVT